MITSAILYVIFGVLFAITSPIRLLSDVSEISSIGSAVTVASSYLHGLNIFLPVTDILAILFVIIVYETGYFGFKIIYWIIKRIPTQS
jgi:hypothetical protein